VLLPLWTEIDIDDALELLGPGTVDARVRRFAVRQLARADDEELLLYLLQLVQALKFESAAAAAEQRTSRSAGNAAVSYEDSGLADFLVQRAVKNAVLGNRLHWYLMVEIEDDKVMGKMYAKVTFKFMTELMKVRVGAIRAGWY